MGIMPLRENYCNMLVWKLRLKKAELNREKESAAYKILLSDSNP